jgi:hypothetical protein
MAIVNKRHKKRILFICILFALLIFWVMADKDLRQLVTGPTLPGYAKSAPAGQFTDIEWKILQQGRWKYGEKPVLIHQIVSLSGKPVHLKGFMLPFHEAGQSSQFFIAEKPRGCYFCNPPGEAEVVQVNIAGNKQLDLTDWPVSVYGILKVAEGKADDKILYLIDDVVIMAER